MPSGSAHLSQCLGLEGRGLDLGDLATLAEDLALPGRPPLQLRGRLHRGGYLHVLHRLHHLHHKTGNEGPDAEPGPGVDVKVTISGENGEDEVVDVPIWNGTVANIVLMSLGEHSSMESFCHKIMSQRKAQNAPNVGAF